MEGAGGRPARLTTAHGVILAQIAEDMRNGLLTPGSVLPTETELGADA
ncbi:hypothetical protein [Pseudarthrobacter phenanthrenivorans]|nr:hypothetical protein [Pseudarthrobacter phenanthrenivorans]